MKLMLLTAMASLMCSGAIAQDTTLPMKSAPGLDTTSATCATCHTTNYIVMNSMFLTPDGWKAEITKMRKAFGAPIDDETEMEIAAYLAANYAVKPKP